MQLSGQLKISRGNALSCPIHADAWPAGRMHSVGKDRELFIAYNFWLSARRVFSNNSCTLTGWPVWLLSIAAKISPTD